MPIPPVSPMISSKGVSPIPAMPWAESMLGCANKMARGSIWAVERMASWEELENLSLEDDNPWLLKYLEFLKALTVHAAGRFPVSQPIIRGVSDLHGALRGHTQSLFDLMEEPEKSLQLYERLTDILLKILQGQFRFIPPFRGGYSQEQFGLWAPDVFVRLQEDATGNFSPGLYRDMLLPFDRRLAAAFPYALIHLHNSSLFLLDHFLEIEEIDCVEINKDTTGMDLEEELPYIKKVQDRNRCVILRGNYTRRELQLMETHLDPAGLAVQIVVHHRREADEYREYLSTLWS